MRYFLVLSKINNKGKVVLAETIYHAIQLVIYCDTFLGHKPNDFKVKKL